MTNQPRQFKHSDVVRAFKAAEAAGVRNATVRVHCPNGSIIHIGSGEQDETAATTPAATKVNKPRPRPAR